MKFLAAIFILLLLILQYKLWLGQGGLRDVWSLESAIAEQREENKTLQERNQTLEAEVRDLKQGLEAVEERARTELGMIKEGETFYQIVE